MTDIIATERAQRWARIRDYFIQYKTAHDGNSPTLRDVTRDLGFSSTSVTHYHLEAMVRAGILYRLSIDESRAYCVRGGKWTYEPPQENPA